MDADGDEIHMGSDGEFLSYRWDGCDHAYWVTTLPGWVRWTCSRCGYFRVNYDR